MKPEHSKKLERRKVSMERVQHFFLDLNFYHYQQVFIHI